MPLPSLQHWVFSLKTFAAAMLALSVALWLDLPHPYWAVVTVYIASNPLSGATRSKAIFRVLGTLIGATATVVLVPNLVNAPVLLVLAMATWLGACLYISLLDRSPRSYVFMLAGYTAALIGFPAVGTPGLIFDLALYRTEEILLGITSAALVSSIVLPVSVGAVVAQRLQLWLSHVDENARDALAQEKGDVADAHRLRLAGNTAEIETLASHLAYDAATEAVTAKWVRLLQPRMLMVLPVLSSISDRLGELAQAGGASPPVAALVKRARDWLEPGRPHDPADLAQLLEGIVAEIDWRDSASDWHGLLELGLLMRLRDFIEIRADCLTLTDAAVRGAAATAAPLSYPIEVRAAPVRHRDHGLALMAALTASLVICACCGFWMATAWPEGGAAAMIAAVASCLFAAQDNPLPALAIFAKTAVVAVLISSLYVFALLPNVHHLETLMLAIAPAFLLFGLLMANPSTYLIGLALSVITGTMMALEGTYAVDAASFMNASHAMIVGIGLAAVVTALLRPVGAEWGVWRIKTANRAMLADAAQTRTAKDTAHVAGLLLDRLMLLAPRAAAAGHTIPQAVREIRSGFNILDLHRARSGLTPFAGRRIDALMQRLTRFYRSQVAGPDAGLLRSIDRALEAIGGDKSECARDAAVGLVGLRRNLFPAAAPSGRLAPELPR